jgi:hypothetical protein
MAGSWVGSWVLCTARETILLRHSKPRGAARSTTEPKTEPKQVVEKNPFKSGYYDQEMADP